MARSANFEATAKTITAKWNELRLFVKEKPQRYYSRGELKDMLGHVTYADASISWLIKAGWVAKHGTRLNQMYELLQLHEPIYYKVILEAIRRDREKANKNRNAAVSATNSILTKEDVIKAAKVLIELGEIKASDFLTTEQMVAELKNYIIIKR